MNNLLRAVKKTAIFKGPSTPKICATQQRNAIPLKCVLQVDKAKDHFPSVALANANRCVRNSEKKKRATQQKTPQRKSFVNRVALDTEADTEPASREKTSASFEGGRTRGPAGGGTLKEASWRARARQVPFLRPLWEGSPLQTRPTRAAHMRARVARGASEPTANIACRAYSCTARRRGSPTKATEWRQASRAFREPRSAAHDCRGPVPPQSRNMSRAKHGSAAAHALGFPRRSHGAVQRPQARGTRRPRAHCACPARWRQHRVPARRL